MPVVDAWQRIRSIPALERQAVPRLRGVAGVAGHPRANDQNTFSTTRFVDDAEGRLQGKPRIGNREVPD
jgi:hypothetical protein